MFQHSILPVFLGLLFLPQLVQANSLIETRIFVSSIQQAPTLVPLENQTVEVGVPQNLAQTGDLIPVAFTFGFNNPTDKNQDIVDSIPLPQGVVPSRVLVNGQELQLSETELTPGSYPLRMTVGPHTKVKVTIIFNTKATVTANLNLLFQGETGGKTSFFIHYPLDVQPGWINSSGTIFGLAGKDASTTVQFAKSMEFPVQILLPHDAQLIIDAERGVAEQPKNLDALKHLSDVYRALRAGDKQERPDFAQKKYLDIEHQYILTKYGSLTEPKTLQEGLELAGIYSDQWSALCQGNCLNDWEDGLYRDLITYVQQHAWDIKIPAEWQAGREIIRRHAEWVQKRPKIDGVEKVVTIGGLTVTSTIPSQSPETKPDAPSAMIDWRLMLGGGLILLLILIFWLSKLVIRK